MVFYSLKTIIHTYIVIWIMGQEKKKSQLQFSITGRWDLGTISQFEPVLGKFQADGRWSHLPSAHLPSGSLVSLWLFFLIAVRKAILLAFFAGQMGSGGPELPKRHPVGTRPLPLVFLCSGCTSPPPLPCRAEFSTEWEPLPHPSHRPQPSALAGSQLGENNIFLNTICV